jgi:hypothetical protein
MTNKKGEAHQQRTTTQLDPLTTKGEDKLTTLGYTFDATSVLSDDFPPLPAGVYAVQMVDSDLRVTKDGNGKYLRAVLEVIGGEYTGRKFFDNINLENPSTTAVEIGHRRFSQICHAINTMQVRDTTQLHDKPCWSTSASSPPRGNTPSATRYCGIVSATPPPHPLRPRRPAATAARPRGSSARQRNKWF